jgi:tetratricopeptide (TPR) repeat protein
MKINLWLVVLFLLASMTALSDEGEHHLAANEKLGTVSFPISCRASVQKPFERGVALLHSFEYGEADRQFQQITKSDPECAMVYWGRAMSLYHQLWDRPSSATVKQGWELLQKAQRNPAKTSRERGFVDALAAFYRDGDKVDHDSRAAAYSRAMENLHKQNPKDSEAAIFYALSLLASAPDLDPSHANQKKAIAILNRLFETQPDHPGIAHYLIHSCDSPQLASLGLAAARRYASIASASPHALHMPSHIFARLGLWQESIRSNLAAIEVADKLAAMHAHTLHHKLHSMDFLEYAYLQIGDDEKAKAIVDQLEGLSKRALDEEFGDRFNALHAYFPAVYALETRQWKSALALQPPANAEPYHQAITYWAHAVAAGHLHDADRAREAVKQIEAMLEDTSKSKPYLLQYLANGRDEAKAWLHFAEGKNDKGLRLLRSVADRQDAVGKGETELPAREMLGDMLLEMNRAQEALAEYERSLKVDPNRFNGLYGAARAADLAKQPTKATTYLMQLQKNCEGTNSARLEMLTRERPGS